MAHFVEVASCQRSTGTVPITQTQWLERLHFKNITLQRHSNKITTPPSDQSTQMGHSNITYQLRQSFRDSIAAYWCAWLVQIIPTYLNYRRSCY